MDKKTIFYFEDKLKWREHFGSFLKNQGFAVDEFCQYEDAIKAATDSERDAPDVAVVDLHAEPYGDNSGLVRQAKLVISCKVKVLVWINQRSGFVRFNPPPVSSVASPAERCLWLRLRQKRTKVRRSVHRALRRSQGIRTSLQLI